MNIDKLNERSETQAAQKTVGLRPLAGQPVVKRDLDVVCDQVDMSMISRFMARSIRVLADSDTVRPEVIAKHQQLPRQNVRFDDHTIDRLFGRMQAP